MVLRKIPHVCRFGPIGNGSTKVEVEASWPQWPFRPTIEIKDQKLKLWTKFDRLPLIYTTQNPDITSILLYYCHGSCLTSRIKWLVADWLRNYGPQHSLMIFHRVFFQVGQDPPKIITSLLCSRGIVSLEFQLSVGRITSAPLQYKNEYYKVEILGRNKKINVNTSFKFFVLFNCPLSGVKVFCHLFDQDLLSLESIHVRDNSHSHKFFSNPGAQMFSL